MNYLGINIQNNVDRFISTKPLDSYPESVLKEIKLLSFEKNKQATPFGSFIYRSQKYPGDIDLVEEFTDCCSVDHVTHKFAIKLKKIVKEIIKMKTHFFSEFKAGLDYRFDIDIGNLENGIYKPSLTLQKEINILLLEKILPENEYDIILDILTKSKTKNLNGNDYDIIFNILREHRILRWTADEILQGYKKLPSKIKKYLEDALADETHVKIDMISLINGKFIEITNFLMLAYIKNGEIHEININVKEQHNIPITLPIEINKLYFSNFYYSPFKMCKRIFSLSRHKHDTATLSKIVPFISSNTSLLYQIKSEIETIILILEKFNNPAPKSILAELDNMKLRLSTVLELSEIDLDYFDNLIDSANEQRNKEKKIDLLKQIKKELVSIINYETIIYLESVGLNPPPSYLLPSNITYDRSLIRTPYEIPPNPLKQVLGGSLASRIFQTGANLYRKNFCNGKSRPLFDGEYHYGCHNFTGPGTRINLPEVKNYPAYNDIDNCSKQHDIDYYNAKGNQQLIRKADEDVLKCYDKYPNENGYLVGKLGINGKMSLENALPFLIKSLAPEYSGVGCDICGGYGVKNYICDGKICGGCDICGGFLSLSPFMQRKIKERLESLPHLASLFQ